MNRFRKNLFTPSSLQKILVSSNTAGSAFKGLGRAVSETITGSDVQTGGSTITMQVAKNYYLSPERTLKRKLTEIFLARKIEQNLSKEEILTLYVNKIFLGKMLTASRQQQNLLQQKFR